MALDPAGVHDWHESTADASRVSDILLLLGQSSKKKTAMLLTGDQLWCSRTTMPADCGALLLEEPLTLAAAASARFQPSPRGKRPP
jgi:hypothetical protein